MSVIRKLFVLALTIVFIFAAVSCSNQPVAEKPFKVGENYYDSLQSACDAALADSTGNSKVELVKDASGPGITVKKETVIPGLPDILLQIDFGSSSYTVTGTTSSGADFDVSGVIFLVSGTAGKLIGSGSALFSLDNTQVVVSQGLAVVVPDNAYLAELKNSSALYAETFFDKSLSGNVSLDNSTLNLFSEKGYVGIGRLEISGSGSQLVFGGVRNTGNTVIKKIVIDSQSAPAIPFTTNQTFSPEEYSEIDKILEETGNKVHRHVFDLSSGRTILMGTCNTNRFDVVDCTDPDCNHTESFEIEGTKDPTKHQLVHVDAVAPTATENGITECQRCERCGQYFSMNDTECKEPINPILLGTDCVPYQDMLDGGLVELTEKMDKLEKQVGGAETRFIPTGISDVLDLLGFAMSVSGEFESNEEVYKEMLGKLNDISSNIDGINTSLSSLSIKTEMNMEWIFINGRLPDLVVFSNSTERYYSEILEGLKAETDSEKKKEIITKSIKKWVNKNGKEIVNKPEAFLSTAFITSANGRNYFQAYDYLGRYSTGWESLSLDYRKAMRTLEMYTMLEGYEMAHWYYEYVYETDDEEDRKNILNDLDKVWSKYRGFCDNNGFITDKKKQITCWLPEYKFTFSEAPKIVNYPGEIERSYKSGENEYRFCRIAGDASNPELITTRSVDKLMEAVKDNCLSYKFYNTVYQWYNQNKKETDQKDLYQILDTIGFNAVNNTRIANCYNNKIYIVADPERDKYSDDDETGTATYKMIMFYQGSKQNKDWIGIGSALSTGGALECQKMFTESNLSTVLFVGPGKITELGKPTGCQFFTLDKI